ncbi:hypothetical protein ES707_00125 [subsurface metagenome]
MEQKNIPKWQEQVEAILRKKFQGDELSKQVKKAIELTDLAHAVGIPSGDTGEAVSAVLTLASEELYPLAAVYAAFQLGVAYERLENANRE